MREYETPILLWVCAAVCAHYVFARGGDHVARVYDDHSAISRLAGMVREKVRTSERTFEVSSLDEGKKSEEETANEVPPAPKPPEPKKPVAKAEPPKPTPEQKKPEKKPEKKIALVPEDPSKPTPPPPPELLDDKRIAVKQHVKDKKQEDNPNARFLAEEANRVEEESVATQTSHDKDDENPTPGGNHAGDRSRAGDSDRTKIADSENVKGEQGHAPGERGTDFDVSREPEKPTDKPQATAAISGPSATEPTKSGGDGKPVSGAPNSPAQAEVAPGSPQQEAPDVVSSAHGSWTFNAIRPGPGVPLPGREAGPGDGSKKPTPSGKTQVSWLGLGGVAAPGQVNLNLSHTGVVAAVGHDQLRRERENDGERRKSEHRGAWAASSFERWRSAIENYVSTVKPGNQTALNTAQSPFATYLVTMHNRIHPIFADAFLGSLDGLPKSHPLNDSKLLTTLEIVLSREGRLVKMGIVRTSGITAFDIAALDSVQRASPFGPAPKAIVSTDGNVYLQWQFHRDEVFACSTMGARPYLLNLPAPAAPGPEEETPGAPPPPSKERGIPPANTPDTREGRWTPLSRPERARHG